ncbi:MAG: septum formation protein Maf [Muribaculaceae bacterium]|nr:septum formation protein Maf [Muribaculaceae bacterium]
MVEFNPLGRLVPPLPAPQYSDVDILLASNSPRRRELLGLIVPHFEVAPSKEIEESYPPTIAPDDVPAFLSQLKASAYKSDIKAGQLLITADTVVILDGKIMGKPQGCDEAIEMVRALAGRTHTVVTGVTLSSLSGKRNDTFSEKTDVTFAELTDEEIEQYVLRFKPYDKAGAYGIQEWVGAAAIQGIAGCFYNVMGLPLHALYTHLKEFFR